MPSAYIRFVILLETFNSILIENLMLVALEYVVKARDHTSAMVSSGQEVIVSSGGGFN